MGFLDELKKLTRPYSDEDEFFSEGDTPAPGPEGEGAQDGRASFFDDGALPMPRGAMPPRAAPAATPMPARRCSA